MVEMRILEIIEGKRSAPLTKALLNLLSQGYRAGIALRHFAYDFFIPATKLSPTVISIGNIVAGGTGKTPFVQYLSKALGESKVAILSRGYRRKGIKTTLVKENTPIEESGDEPALLAQKLPQARVIVGANRIVSGMIAQSIGAQIILLDDGMQHRQLHRDIEIGIMDARDLFGKGHYLPRGFLRDSPKRLAKADLIILNGVKDQTHFDSLTAQIRQYSQAPITAMSLIVENSPLLASKKVAAFCGIAAPDRFIDTLKTLGCDIVLLERKGDHLPFDQEELEQLANRAHDLGAECLVCTEKDAIKLPKKIPLRLPLIAVKIALKPTFGCEHLEKIIKEVHQ